MGTTTNTVKHAAGHVESTGQEDPRGAAIAATLRHRDLMYCRDRGVLEADDPQLLAAADAARAHLARLTEERDALRAQRERVQAALEERERDRRVAWALATYPELARLLASAERALADAIGSRATTGQFRGPIEEDAARQRIALLRARIAELGAKAPDTRTECAREG